MEIFLQLLDEIEDSAVCLAFAATRVRDAVLHIAWLLIIAAVVVLGARSYSDGTIGLSHLIVLMPATMGIITLGVVATRHGPVKRAGREHRRRA